MNTNSFLQLLKTEYLSTVCYVSEAGGVTVSPGLFKSKVNNFLI